MNPNSLFWKRAAVALLVVNALGWTVTALRTPRAPAPSPAAEPSDAPAATNAPAVPVPAPVVQPPPAPKAPPPLGLYSVRANVPDKGNPSIFLGFQADVDPVAIAPYIVVKPECRYEVRHESRRWKDDILLVGDFSLGTTYTVTVRAGCPANDENRSPVDEDLVRVIDIPNRQPRVAFADQGRHLSPEDGTALVRIDAVNIPKAQITLERLRDANLHALVRASADRWWNNGDPYPERTSELSGPLLGPVEFATAAPLNETRTVEVDLARCLPEGQSPRGIFLARLRHGEHGEYTDDDRLVVLSDIALTARHSSDRLLVWATSIATARPLAGVRVSLVSTSNAPIAEGTTDEDGTVSLVCRPDKGDAFFFLVATSGDDQTYLPLTDSVCNATPSLEDPLPEEARWLYDDAKYEAFVYAPRDIVRPGETLPVKAVVRDLRGRLPGTFPVALRLFRPDGREAATTNAPLSALGTLETAFTFAREWPTGLWRVGAFLPGGDSELGALSVKVEDIVPPQIKAAIDAGGKKPLVPGDKAAATLRADYLFGAPCAGLSYDASIRFEAVPFAPKGWKEYCFGDAARNADLSRYIGLDRRMLDATGQASLEADVPTDLQPPAALKAVFSATVRQPGGRAVSAWASRPVAPVPWYVGLRRATEDAVEVGSSEDIAIALVSPAGELLATNRALTVSLERIDRSWNWRRNSNGDWTYESHTDFHPVTNATRTVETADGAATLAQVFPEHGEFRLRVADPDTGASTTVDIPVVEPGRFWEPAGKPRPFAVTLATDRDAYVPGDLVTLSVKAPFAGRALLTLEGDREWRHRVVELDTPETTLQFPVDDIDVPSLCASLTVLRPDEAAAGDDGAGAPRVLRAAGTALVRVVRPERALEVALDAPAEMLPSGRLSVSAQVLSGSRPEAGAEVTFAAVDEGICSLTDFKTPDPLAWANAPHWRPLWQYDLFRRLLPRLGKGRAVEDSHIGGGAEGGLAKRLNPLGRANRFRLVALWSGTVAADSNGVARAEFDVPEFTGSLRVMAVAVGAARYGSAEHGVLVRRPVTVVPTLPRFAAPGDAFDATVEFHNTVSNRALLRFEAAAVAGTPAAGAVSETLLLQPGQSAARTVRFHAAREAGVAKFLFRATDESSGSRFYEETVELPVRPAASYETRVLQGVLKPGETFRAADALKGAPAIFGASASLVCSTRPSVEFGEALEYLVHYPYGCLEQTTSSAFPLLYLKDVAEGIRPDLFRDTRCREYVRAGIRRVAGMQRYGGCFTLWPDGIEPYVWGSIYATHFLVEAKKAGYDVPDDTLKSALGYVCSLLSNTGLPDTPENQCLRAYAAYVATLGGRAENARPWTVRLFERRADLPRYARACLAGALLSGGRPQDAATLLAEQDLLPPDDADYRDLGGLLHSPVRDLALVLSAQCDLDPDAPLAAEAAQRLLARRADDFCRWYTTQENAMALVALGKYFRATLGAPDGAAPKGEFRASRRDEPAAFDLAKDFAWNGSDVADAVLRNTGDAPFRYALVIAGVPVEPPAEEVRQSLAVARTFLDAQTGKPLEPGKDGAWEFAAGDLVAVQLEVRALDGFLDQVVVSDLLPAGLEIENPALATSEARPGWMDRSESAWTATSDIRDDRLLLFSGRFDGRQSYTYLVRAVSVGEFVLPAPEAEAMYNPAVRARGLPGRVVIK